MSTELEADVSYFERPRGAKSDQVGSMLQVDLARTDGLKAGLLALLDYHTDWTGASVYDGGYLFANVRPARILG